MNNRAFSKIWIIIILISFIAGAFLTWQYFGAPKGEIKDEIADWQIYKNEKYGYEIKCPGDWQIDLTDAPSRVNFDVERNNFLTKEEFKDRWGPYYDMRFWDDIRITVYESLSEIPDNKDGLSLDAWIEKRMAGYLILRDSKREIAINKYKGVEVEESGLGSYRSIFLLHRSFIYNFFLDAESPQDTINIVNQMLSTFRFLE